MRRLAGLGHLDVWYASGELDELAARYRAILSKRERELAGTDQRPPAVLRLAPWPVSQAVTTRCETWRGLSRRETARPGSPARRRWWCRWPTCRAAAASRRCAGSWPVIGHSSADRRHLIGQFTVADMARKVSGVGSVGLRCWVVLLTGRDVGDQLFLQLKEAQRSVLSEFAGASHRRARRARRGRPAAHAGG